MSRLVEPASQRQEGASIAPLLQRHLVQIRTRLETAVQTREMIATHPDVRGSVNQALIDAIDAAYTCAQTCTSCADACLAEEPFVRRPVVHDAGLPGDPALRLDATASQDACIAQPELGVELEVLLDRGIR